jgi:pyridoxal phosphate enzyme (YggS family)
MIENLIETIQNNYRQVRENVEKAAHSVGRDPGSVKLLVVTKGHPIKKIQAVLSAGGKYFGENYVEEATPKIKSLSDKHIEWHMIGHVQSRKARWVSEYFDWVHSLDSYKLARRLDNFSREYNRVIPVLLECNLSHEASKFGWSTWDEDRWPEFADEISPILELPNLAVSGLMTMPPYDPDPEKSRSYYVKLRKLQSFLAGKFPQASFSELSMGMSGDYQVAVQEGATIVRVGTAIVGQRIN